MADGNRKRKIVLMVSIVIIVSIFVTYYVWVGSCAEGDPVTGRDYWIKSFLPQLGNSAIVFVVLWYVGWPAIQKWVLARKTSIEHDIDESGKMKLQAEVLEGEARRKLADFAMEKAQIDESYRMSAQGECARIREGARHEVARIEKDARAAFELEDVVARRSFEDEVMRAAIEKARGEIVARLARDEALRNKLIDENIASIEL